MYDLSKKETTRRKLSDTENKQDKIRRKGGKKTVLFLLLFSI